MLRIPAQVLQVVLQQLAALLLSLSPAQLPSYVLQRHATPTSDTIQ